MTDPTPVIDRAARAILGFEAFKAQKRRRSRSRPPGQKHKGDTHKRYPGPTCADVLNDHTDDLSLWCHLAAAANRRANELREKQFTHTEEE